MGREKSRKDKTKTPNRFRNFTTDHKDMGKPNFAERWPQ